jgi:uncharacterized circularly permuted ATP-grasp superfamily protein
MSAPPRAARADDRGYEPPYIPEAFDEALDAHGRPRPGYEDVIPALLDAELDPISDRIAEFFDRQGVEFASSEGSLEFHVDPVPRILTAAEWDLLERGLRQRADAINAFIRDVYSEQRIVREGRVPARVVETAEYFEPEMVGIELPERPASVIGFDVVRDADGEFAVLEDNCRTPSGMAYMLAARAAIDAYVPLTPPGERRDALLLIEELGNALRAAAPGGGGDPSIALLTDGPENSGWFDHQELAARLGVPLVTGGDLEVRNGRVYATVGDEPPREIQVLYRRTDDEGLRDGDGDPTWLSELLLDPIRHGNLALVTSFGTGVADDKLSHAYVEEMIRFYLDAEPILPSLRSYDLAVEAVREEVLDRLEEMVVKPRALLGGEGIVIASQEDRGDLDETVAQVRERPEDFVAQRRVTLSTHPTHSDGALRPRHVDLRIFALGDSVPPAALSRVALEEGSLIVNSSQGGGAKDTWVLAEPGP